MHNDNSLPSKSAANVGDCRKEADMNKQKYTILYERLSRDDGEDSVSNSIKNQRAMLEEYAERNGLVPFRHIQEACDIIEPNRRSLAPSGFRGFGQNIIITRG